MARFTLWRQWSHPVIASAVAKEIPACAPSLRVDSHLMNADNPGDQPINRGYTLFWDQPNRLPATTVHLVAKHRELPGMLVFSQTSPCDSRR